MSVEVGPFEAADLAALNCRDVHGPLRDTVLGKMARLGTTTLPGTNWTFTAENGKVLLCAGVVPDSSVLWAFLSKDAAPLALPLVRAARRELTALGHMVYADIDPADPKALRFVQALGFKPYRGRRWAYGPVSG